MIRPARAVVFGAAYVLLALGTQLGCLPYASAQWLPDRAYTEGPGFRAGNVEIHPGLALRAGYDTNVYRTPGTTAFPRDDGAMLAVTPHLHISSIQQQRRTQGEDAAGAAGLLPPPVMFDFGAAATFFQYFAVANARRNLDVDVDGALNILPERTFGLDVGATYTRSTRPFTAQSGNSNQTFAFDRIRPSLILRGQSRGGVLRGRIGFSPTLTIYEGDAFKYLNQNQYEVPAGLAWKFLPNTAIVYDVGYAFVDYTQPTRGNNVSVFLSDGQRFQTRLGVNGAITPNLGVRALVGYAAVVQQQSELDDHEDAIAEAAITFAWSRKDNVEAGYQRMVEMSALSGWTQLDRGYVKLGTLLGGRFALNVEGGVAGVNYGRLLGPDEDGTGAVALGTGNDTSRKDIRVDAGVHGEVRATNWLAFLADFQALVNLTDFEYALPNSPVPYPGRFATFQIFGGVRAHY
jgi:hypothetical protein